MASADSADSIAPALQLALDFSAPARVTRSAARARPSHKAESLLLPRFVRFRDAPRFFGMDKNRFNREVRPRLTEIPIGRQGVAFDLLEMMAAAEDYKTRNGVPVAQSERSKPLWEFKGRRVSPSAEGSGMSTRSSEELAFARALEQAICGKPTTT